MEDEEERREELEEIGFRKVEKRKGGVGVLGWVSLD